jgi:acyl-coenzyme A thioesterase PaaI-like protein
VADSAGGYAAYTLFPADSSVLTVEFKVNLIAPADGERVRAVGQVIRSGRTLTICELRAYALKAGRETQCLHGMATLMCLSGRSDRPAPQPASSPSAK